jgi:hypothetical protein
MSKPRASFFDLGADALQRCPPQFQVISLLTIFLSVLASMVYILYLALYAPVERVVILLTLGYAGWQMQHASSVHQHSSQSSIPGIRSEPSILLSTSSDPTLPAYTPKSTDSPRSDDPGVFLSSDYPPVSVSNLPSPTFLSKPPRSSIYSAVNEPPQSSTASATVSPAGTCRLVAVHHDGTERYCYDNPCPLTESRQGQPQRQTVDATIDSKVLVTPGATTTSTRVVKELDDRSLELEVSCGNIDYRIQLSPSEVLQLYERSVKRPP